MAHHQRPNATRATDTVTNRSAGSLSCSIATRTQSHTATAETSRTYITHLIEAGYDPAFVQTQAGHAYASVTSVYTSVGDDFKQKTIQKMFARRIARPEEANPDG